MAFEASDELLVKLTAAEWNQVLGVLQDTTGFPYRVIAPLIVKIGGQCQEQAVKPSKELKEPDIRIVPKDSAE